MELTLHRHRQNKSYTLSRLYETLGRKFFCLDVVEPPASGLAEGGPVTLNPGRYKLFLKPDFDGRNVVPCFQRVYHRQRFGLEHTAQPQPLEDIDFRSTNKVFVHSLLCGRFDTKTGTLHPSDEDYRALMMRMIIAKQHRESILINVN